MTDDHRGRVTQRVKRGVKLAAMMTGLLALAILVSAVAFGAFAVGTWGFANIATFLFPRDPIDVVGMLTIVFALGWGFTVLYAHSLALGYIGGDLR